jgi:serine/threonine protein kinase
MPPNTDLNPDEFTQLGRYQIKQRLGGGTHAVVYQAEDTLLNRTVALKVLKPMWASDPEMVSRFTREARAAANLMHSHIAWVFDFGEIEGVYFLAVRYVEGPTLDRVIEDRGKIPWQESLEYLSELGSALDYAHGKDVIHRDVKPKNIIISASEGAVLTDFGLVKTGFDASFQTKADMIIGTPEYIPPEIWNGEKASPATDQYALACVFVEMLSGKPLFSGTRLDEIIRKHLEPPSLSDTWPGEIPPGAELILRQALSPNPEDRFPNQGAFVKALKETKPITSEEILRRSQQFLEQQAQQQASGPISMAADSADRNHLADKEHLAEKNHLTEVKRPNQAPPLTQPFEGDSLPSSSPPPEEIGKGWKRRIRSLVNRPPQSEKEAEKAASKKFALRLQAKPVKVFHLEGDQLTLGRSPDCHIALEDMNVSRHHARLLQADQGYKIQDLNSKNGTFVNGKQITGIAPLTPGDEVMLGSTTLFVFEQE